MKQLFAVLAVAVAALTTSTYATPTKADTGNLLVEAKYGHGIKHGVHGKRHHFKRKHRRKFRSHRYFRHGFYGHRYGRSFGFRSRHFGGFKRGFHHRFH